MGTGLNRQVKQRGGQIVGRGIEWTGWAVNEIGGCHHGCRWRMPDGSIAVCYAETVAEGVARAAYPEGFAHHYHHPGRLAATLRIPTTEPPQTFFVDSMADCFGAWVPAAQIQDALDTIAQGSGHIYQSLTKNAPRMLRFTLPPNLWAGVSSPPDFLRTKRGIRQLTRRQQEKMLHTSLRVLSTLAERGHPVTWMSFEPLSWDVSAIVAQYPQALRWAVVGAATNGPRVFLPEPQVVRNLLVVLDRHQVPVFFKGNLRGSPAARPWREFYPGFVPSAWNEAASPGGMNRA